jgi:hypothetical protein
VFGFLDWAHVPILDQFPFLCLVPHSSHQQAGGHSAAIQ